MQRQVVVDEVDAPVIGITPSDVLEEGEHLVCGLGQPIAAKQHTWMDIVSAEEVADPTSAYVGRSSTPGPLALRAALARVGLEPAAALARCAEMRQATKRILIREVRRCSQPSRSD